MTMTEALAGKVVIVTGAASGIGRACARLLAADACRLVLVDVNQAALQDLGGELSAIQPSSELLALRLSVCDEQDMQRMRDDTIARFGRIDALVACAGILRVGAALKTVADTSLAEWRAVLDTNLTGCFLSNRAVLPAMAAQRQGDIINLSSTSGRHGRPFDGPYCASKFGIIGLSESLAEEMASQGVRVQTLLPDAVETPLWQQNGPRALKPVNLITPERVAEFIRYMLALPRDAYLLNPVLAPFKGRRKQRPAS
jgi:NAD(P)-dependent dehydrogenase (short-subunit alcohol dehydrogenase family)